MTEPDWTRKYSSVRRREISTDGERVRFLELGYQSEINLGDVPDHEPLVIGFSDRSTRNTLTLTNARPLHIVIVDHSMTVNVEGLGELRIENLARSERVDLVGSVINMDVAVEGDVGLTHADVDLAIIHSGGVLSENEFTGTVELHGAARLPRVVSALRVLTEVAELDNGGSLEIKRLEAGTSSARLLLRGPAPQPGQGYRASTTVQSCIGAISIELENLVLTVHENANSLHLQGTGILHVPPNRDLIDVHVESPLKVQLGEGTSIIRMTGSLHAIACRGATVIAPVGQHFTLAGIDNLDLRDHPLDAATLRGVKIDASPAGRRHLGHLAKAASVDPYIAHLPPFSWEWRRPFARRKLLADQQGRPKHQDPQGRRALSDSALFVQELAGLTQHKSSSGALRTKTSWAAYRARHLDSDSRWERAALAVFRLVGYGQRPGPAALTWLVTSLLAATMISLGRAHFHFGLSGNPSGWKAFGELALNFLLSPFVLVRLAAEPQAQDLSAYHGQAWLLLRTLAAVPFVFTAVATARFLRAEWPW